MSINLMDKLRRWRYWPIVGRWSTFAIVISLSHLWIGILYALLHPSESTMPLLRGGLFGGALIFFSNGLAAGVLADSWNQKEFILAKRLHRDLELIGSLWRELTGPSLIIMVGIAVYCVIISDTHLNVGALLLQIALAGMALYASAAQAIRNDFHLEMLAVEALSEISDYLE